MEGRPVQPETMGSSTSVADRRLSRRSIGATTPVMHTQQEYWNGDAGARWAKHQAEIDRSVTKITDAWLAAVAPRPTDRALDVGCGCGTTTGILRERTASVLGIDVSAPMLAVAKQRGGDYVLADAAIYPFEPRFDLVTSRFGVMFFADPVAAFANLRRSFAPGARMTFVCWRSAEANRWASAPLAAIADVIPLSEPADPNAPGPFAFADAARVRSILHDAGYQGIALEPVDASMFLGPAPSDAVDHCLRIGPLARAAADLDDGARLRIRERLLTTFERDGTTYDAAIWIVHAR